MNSQNNPAKKKDQTLVNILKFFLGTGPRILTTLVCMTLIWACCNLEKVSLFLNVLWEIMTKQVFPLAIVILGISLIFRHAFKKPVKNNEKHAVLLFLLRLPHAISCNKRYCPCLC